MNFDQTQLNLKKKTPTSFDQTQNKTLFISKNATNKFFGSYIKLYLVHNYYFVLYWMSVQLNQPSNLSFQIVYGVFRALDVVGPIESWRAPCDGEA